MKKILLLTLSAACLPALGLPTYEPFTEYAANIATNTAGAQTNSINLCTAGLIAPGGEPWVCQFFSGADTNSTTNIAGLDIQVTNNPASPFTAATLANLLPATFPGFPASGGAITTTVINPGQPGATNGMVGNSAALQFAQDFTRPATGAKTLFVSYLFNDCQVGQTGSGNIGRYLNFVAASNVVCGTGTGSYANGWQAMNNTFGANTGPRYFGHGVFNPNPFSIVPQDSAAGKSALTNYTTFPYTPSLTSAAFVVGEFVFVSTNASKAGVKDTNILWVNPSIGGFGGASPQGSPILTYSMVITMNDVGGMVLLDRPGSGQSGGVGTNFIANLLLGSTWSYVTGGPEFTNQPASALGTFGSTVSMTGGAATAPGQTVTYQWQHVFSGTTNNLANGLVNPGGAATVSGATTGALTLAGISNGDTNGFYQLVATSSGTGFSLASAPATVTYDPLITVQPQQAFTTPGGTATFTITATTQFPSLSYQWQLNGANLSDGTLPDGSVVTGSGTSTLTIANAQKDENDSLITVGVTNGLGQGELSAAAELITTDPAITAQPLPVQITVNYGGQASFTASALTATANQPLGYAWFHNETQLANGAQPDGSTASGAAGTSAGNTLTTTLALSGVSYLDNGSYSLIVTNALGLTATSAVATLFVNDPVITAEPPATLEIAQGSTANIAFGAAGTGLTYQWFNVNGPLSGDFSGANSPTLTISGAQTNDDGTYYVTAIGPTNSLQSSNVTLIVDTPVTSVTVTPGELTQQAGTHLALVGAITGGLGGPLHAAWQLNGATLANGAQADGTTVSGAGTTTLVLANIHAADSGSYTLTASNAAGALSASSVLTVSSSYLPLSQTNLVVSRVGEGSQTLSGATGNTLYLDQFTTNGGYVNSIMVPDSGSSALIVPGAGSDGLNESYLTLSSNNLFLNFAGYFQNYPFTGGSDVTAGGTAFARSIGAVNGVGFYTLAYTNEGLYSGGDHFIRAAYSTDGLTNFWTTGAAGSAAIKYVNAGPAGASYATGNGIPGLSTSVTGPIMLGQVGPNLVFSDNSDSSLLGLDEFIGGVVPEANVSTSLMLSEGSPADFAFSPDSNTVYVADSSAAISGGLGYGGGIQRWDYAGGSYVYQYNLEDTTAAGTNGARGVTVVFPTSITAWGVGVSGAVVYATTSEAVSNRLIKFTDTNVLSGGALTQISVPTVLATAGPNQFLRGVRFAPAALPLDIVSTFQSTNIFTGLSDTLTVTITGDAPITYQWQLDGTNIAGATTSALALTNLVAANSGTYSVIVKNPATTLTNSAVITVTNAAPILVVGPQSRIETQGDHLAFSVTATGTLPIQYQWAFDGSNIAGATAGAIQLTNITSANDGAYSVVYTNIFGAGTNSATLLVTTTLQPLSSNNLIVARVGDGAQALSAATGNTLYLDQITPAGVYSNTIMIPDNAAAGSLIESGGAAELQQNAVLNVSANNSNFLNFPGFAATYPANNTLVGELVPRAVGAVDAFGYYSEPITPITLYDGTGDDFFDSAVSADGYGEFWTTGTAGSPPSIKYVLPATAGTAGGIAALAGSATGTRVVQIVSGNLVYSDALSSPAGIWAFSGEPIGAAGAINVLADATGNPDDFAVSPDTISFPPTTSTVYVCDSSPIANGGGIQRYDWNGSAYALSYTLGTATGSLAGAGCLAVDFSANATWGSSVTGAKIYATTTGNAGNSLIEIIDTGSNSTATVLETANPNQVLRGVRFGPVQGPVIIATAPQPTNAFVGGTAVFTVFAENGPLTYQWQLNGANLSDGPSTSGSGAIISGAQSPTLTIAGVGPADDQGNYTVVVNNPFPNGTATSATVALTVPVQITQAPVAFESVTNGGAAVFTVAATGGAPVNYQWSGPCGPLTDGAGGDPCDSSAVVSGSSTGTLTIAGVNSADGGQYYVTVSNPESSANTAGIPTALYVYTGPPLIVADIEPPSVTTLVGGTVSFSVTVAGTQPLVYQWQQNGTNVVDNGRISGAQTSVLTISNALASDTGNYQLFITNSAGNNSSSVAALTVSLIGFNGGGGWSASGNAIFSGNSLELTEGGTSETSSAFLQTKFDVAGFLATWTYQESPGAGAADGTAFVLQNSSAGAAALGGGGGDLGYVGITGGSIAFELDIYSPNTIGIAIGTNGLGKGGTTATGGGPYGGTGSVNIASGDPIGVSLEYVNGTAQLTLTDSNTLATYTTNFNVNVTNFVGASTAYVGFTGAAGGVASSQTVSDFFFTSLPSVSAAKASGQSLVLSWPASAPGLVLQQTVSLSSPNWVTVTNAAVIINGQNQVTVTPTGSAAFYRLAIQ